MQLTAPKIRRSFVNLKPRDSWSFRDAARKEMHAHTHGYHRYPAKFIPHLVQQLIKKYAPKGNEIICDPFGGCGTTLVEAKISGRKSFGFDINPVAKLITQVKVTPISPKLLMKYRAEFLRHRKKTKRKTIKHHSRISYWFDARTVRSLDAIYLGILSIKNHNVRRFFLCAFSHNLKNCSRWLMKSIKPTVDKQKIFPEAKESFLRHLDSMIRKNEQFYTALEEAGHTQVPAKMYRRDSTKKLPVEANSVDIIITSPPYVTSYEYADLHQLSLLWFGGDPKHFKKWNHFSDEFIKFRKNFVGSSSKDEQNGEFNSEIGKQIVTALAPIERPLAIDVANYFLYMKKVFGEMHRILKKNGKACIIIGNTNL